MITASDTVVDHLDLETQQRSLGQIVGVLEQARLFRPRARGGIPMRVRVSAAGTLGWVGDEKGYRYTPTQANGKPWPEMPEEWVEIYQRVGKTTLRPDSAIINWYDPDASLGFHQDLTEHDLSHPIVTFSIGDSARWAVKAHEDDRPTRCILQSGAVTLLAGPTRLYYHAIEAITAEPMFSPLRRRGRYSVTMRVAGKVQ